MRSTSCRHHAAVIADALDDLHARASHRTA
jgi:hypothetical protein